MLYAQVDGSFAVWDPARNYWRKKGDIDVQDRPPAYVFSPKEVWDGLQTEKGEWLCNGLIRDWASWQREDKDTFGLLEAVINALSPSNSEELAIGELTRISLDDARDIPTLKTPYGEDIPVVFASAGVRRIIALAYLLVWTWYEHLKACELLDKKPESQVIFLIDEIEAHLHPRWQRSVIRSLLKVVTTLAEPKKQDKRTGVQLIAITHSPLVMASVEPLFDPRQDAWFDLDLENGAVVLTRRDWRKHGDASDWLTSEAFDLPSARSIEAEQALEEAAVAMSDPGFGKARAKALHKKLLGLLGDTDPFWVRWRFVAEKQGWLE